MEVPVNQAIVQARNPQCEDEGKDDPELKGDLLRSHGFILFMVGPLLGNPGKGTSTGKHT
jgi:hypothetical protein